jgi:hypothetical protein
MSRLPWRRVRCRRSMRASTVHCSDDMSRALASGVLAGLGGFGRGNNGERWHDDNLIRGGLGIQLKCGIKSY